MTRRLRPIDVIASDVPGIAWPPIARGPRAELLALTGALDRSQWFAPDVIARGQFRQLGALTAHAARHSPHFASRLRAAGMKAADLARPEGLAALPLLRREDLQHPAADVDCAALPDGHGPVSTASSSGSTGEPVTVRKTALEARFWQAMTLRWLFWSGSDPGGRLAVARANVKGDSKRADWGPPVSTLFRTGPALVVDVRQDYEAMGDAFAAFDPHALLAYPSNLAALLDRIDAGVISLPSLASVRLLGETVSDALRERTKGRFALSSCYSTAELGYLTVECAQSGLHHIMSETAIVEILREDGTPAREGEAGRVVATALHNFATPLIRYDVGDWAEVGPPCPCGRGLPTLRRIHGRTRNRMVLPDGRTRWALTGSIRFGDLPVAQAQLVQHSRERLELRYTSKQGPLAPEQAQAVRQIVEDSTDPGFAIDLSHVEGRLDNPANGKFEEFVSKI
jgi:phenylacetate-CoA ligase